MNNRIYGNRKWRKKKKMVERGWFAVLGKTPSLCEGFRREIMLMRCKSSSIETFRLIDKKIHTATEEAVKSAIQAWFSDPKLNAAIALSKSSAETLGSGQ